MQKELINNLALLRLVVGYLGEKEQFNWWPSSFLTENSYKFLGFTFPKTASLAQYEGVSASAAKIHDDKIGVGKTFHLFRLPEYLEKSLAIYIQTKYAESSLTSVIHSNEEALAVLTDLAGKASLTIEGPVNIGGIDAKKWSGAISKIAAAYLTAFNDNKQVYPYFGVNDQA